MRGGTRSAGLLISIPGDADAAVPRATLITTVLWLVSFCDDQQLLANRGDWILFLRKIYSGFQVKFNVKPIPPSKLNNSVKYFAHVTLLERILVDLLLFEMWLVIKHLESGLRSSTPHTCTWWHCSCFTVSTMSVRQKCIFILLSELVLCSLQSIFIVLFQ